MRDHAEIKRDARTLLARYSPGHALLQNPSSDVRVCHGHADEVIATDFGTTPDLLSSSKSRADFPAPPRPRPRGQLFRDLTLHPGAGRPIL
jgi:hypothetical protein